VRKLLGITIADLFPRVCAVRPRATARPWNGLDRAYTRPGGYQYLSKEVGITCPLALERVRAHTSGAMGRGRCQGVRAYARATAARAEENANREMEVVSWFHIVVCENLKMRNRAADFDIAKFLCVGVQNRLADL